MEALHSYRRVQTRSDSGAATCWGVPEEAAIEIGFNGQAWTVMLATPADLADLAVGIAVSEDAIRDPTRIRDLHVHRYAEGFAVDVEVDAEGLDVSMLRRRALDGITGCGLCGVERLADAVRRPQRQSGQRPTIASESIARAFNALAEHQPLNRATRTVHAAAWCAPDGDILLVREDIGRHNALDKLIGALHRGGLTTEPGFITLSSRCSFELVSKAARTVAGVLATLSAPTGMALDLACELQLPVACRGPEDQVMWFPGGTHGG